MKNIRLYTIAVLLADLLTPKWYIFVYVSDWKSHDKLSLIIGLFPSNNSVGAVYIAGSNNY